MVAIRRLIPQRAVSQTKNRPAAAPVNDIWGDLMVQAQNGHGGAYQRLLTELSQWLTRYFSRRLPLAEVDDAVQEALMAVHRRRHTYDPAYPLAAWVAAIARNKWIDQLRAISRRAAEELDDTSATPGHETAVTSASVLAGLLATLNPAQARVISLVKVEGYSLAEASTISGQSLSAVKMNISRGLARLTAQLENDDDVD